MNILLIEDDNRVGDFLRRGLACEGWSVQRVEDGESALDILREGRFDVILLDLMLPGISGQDVCRRLRARRNGTPILILSALDATEERVEGLRLGADDYLAKPFDFDELIVRIEALHRRATGYAAVSEDAVLRVGAISFDRAALVVRVDGATIDLSVKERELLVLFLSNAGRVLSRERILNAVWAASSDPLTNVVDVYVGRLRRKLGAEGARIVTLRHVGYRFDVSDRTVV